MMDGVLWCLWKRSRKGYLPWQELFTRNAFSFIKSVAPFNMLILSANPPNRIRNMLKLFVSTPGLVSACYPANWFAPTDNLRVEPLVRRRTHPWDCFIRMSSCASRTIHANKRGAEALHEQGKLSLLYDNLIVFIQFCTWSPSNIFSIWNVRFCFPLSALLKAWFH